jgi:nucleoside-diphosphate-sugar epimerase
MKIFVTGISGFIGSHLWEYFSPDDDIYVLARKSVEVTTPGLRVTVLQGDLSAPAGVFDALKKIRPDACLHLAWEGIPDLGYENSFKNLQQSALLLRFLAEECNCRKIIAAGSCFEYGKNFGPCREDEAVLLNSYFVWAKNALYNLGSLLASKHSISFNWFRFFYVYGPGQRSGSLIPTLAASLMEGQAPSVKTPLNANDFIYVKDIAQALVLAAHQELATGIYNLGTGISVPVWKVSEMLEDGMGLSKKFSGEMKCSTVPASADFWADTSKVEAALGWSPPTSLAEGLKQYLSSVRKS